MLYKQTVKPELLEVLKRLMNLPQLNDFVLVGGTALSLQIGHRKSIDIDLFSNKDFDIFEIENILIEKMNFMILNKTKGSLMGHINQIKIDVISHRYSWIKPFKIIDDMVFASLEDIVAMKLNAISNDGTRLKDFVDIRFLGKFFSVHEMIRFYALKYPNINSIMAMKSLCYFDDIDFDVVIDFMNEPIQWQKIRADLIKMTQNPDKLVIN